jgi:hypothetical protein
VSHSSCSTTSSEILLNTIPDSISVVSSSYSCPSAATNSIQHPTQIMSCNLLELNR